MVPSPKLLLACLAAAGLAGCGATGAASPPTASPRGEAEPAEVEAPAEIVIDESGDLEVVRASGDVAEGLRLYARGEHLAAAVLLADVVERRAAPDPVSHAAARFFLAKALFHLGFPAVCLVVLEELVEEPDHPFRLRAIPWLSALARRLPDPDGAIALLGRFAPEEVAAAAEGQPEELLHHLRYLRARAHYRVGEFPEAVEALERVDEYSRFFLEARLFEGAAQIRQRAPERAIVSFHAVLRATRGGAAARDDEARRLTDLAWLSAGRLHYWVAGDDEAALRRSAAAFARVSPGGGSWSDALVGRAWALYRLGDFDGVLEAIAALPAERRAADPETALLAAAARFERCELDEAEAALAALRSTHGDTAAALLGIETELGELPDEALSALPAPARAVLGRQLEGGYRRACASHDELSEELLRLESLALASSPEGASLDELVLTILEISRAVERERLGSLLHARAARAAEEVREALAETERASAEIATARSSGRCAGAR